MANENEKDEIFSMGEIMDKVDASMKRIHAGDVLKGRVIAVTDSKVLVNIGYISDGIIEREEMSDNPEVSPRELVKIDDEIYVYVMDANDEGTVQLSRIKAEAVKVWDDFQESMDSGKPMELKVTEVVNGGVVARISGIRAFIPASHLSLRRVENLNDFVGQTVTAKVLEFDRDKERVVFSVRELEKKENEKKKNELLKTIQKGDVVKGVVSRLAKFGAFVDLGGIDGLVHLTELSWKRVNDPAEVVSVGDEVEVYVLQVDAANSKISLGLRNVNENPWKDIASSGNGKLKVDAIVEGKVVRLADFGAFVEIGPGIEGLVHISQISDEHITRPSSILSVGDLVKVKIVDIKEAERRISLSIKDAADIENGSAADSYMQQDEDFGTTIGDALKDKLKGLKFED